MAERALLLIAIVVVLAAGLLLARALVRRRTAERLGEVLPDGVAVGQTSAPTVLYFWGPACAACDSQKRALDTLGVDVIAVEAAREPALTSWAGVLTIPSTAIVDPARRLRAVNHGFRPAAELSEQLAAIG